MRKLTENDITNIIGTTNSGYTVVRAKIKQNTAFSDSDHYGIALAKSEKSGKYVTWQFHLDDEEISYYWGGYHDNEESAVKDFEVRS